MFNAKISLRSPLGVTELLLVDYIAGYFEDHYNQAKGTSDKKPTEMVGKQKEAISKEDILKKYNI